RELETRAGLVPHTAVVARHHSETIIARRQIVVERLAPRTDLLPVFVLAFELDSKLVLFWRDQTEGGVVDLHVARQSRQTDRRRDLVHLVVRDDLLDVYGRRQSVKSQATRVDDAQAIWRKKPEPSVGRLGYPWVCGRSDRLTPDPIRAVEYRDGDAPCGIRQPPVHIFSADPHQPAGRVQPQRLVVVSNDVLNRVAGQAIRPRQRRNAAISQPTQSSRSRSPERAIRIGAEAAD